MKPHDQGDAHSVDSVLRRAETLASSGRFREAIALLVESNRTNRHAEVERRLIGLRHEAYIGAGSHAITESTAAARAGDSSAVTTGGLTADTLARAIRTDGYLHAPALVPTNRVGQLVDDIDRAFSAYDEHAEGLKPALPTPWYEPFEPGPAAVHLTRPWLRKGGGVFAADSPRTFFDLFESYEEAGVLGVVSEFLGERPVVSLDKSTLRRVDAGDGITWHQDGAFLGSDVRAVNIWLSLTESGEESPGLELVPKRLDHIVDMGTDRAEYCWSVSPSLVEATAGDSTIRHPVLAPGDALLFDGLLLHRTCPGHDDRIRRTRYAIETWFFATSTYPAQQQVPLVV